MAWGTGRTEKQRKLTAANIARRTPPTLEQLHHKVDGLLEEARALRARMRRESAETQAAIGKVQELKDTAVRIQKSLARQGNGDEALNADGKSAVRKLVR
jgi:hypothetical protein